MSTILDSLKKSSDKRDEQNSDSMGNFNFGSPKSSSGIRYVLLFLFIVVFSYGFYYYMKNYYYADVDFAEEETIENVNKQEALDNPIQPAAKKKNVITNALKENKVSKPDATDVKQKVQQIEQAKTDKEKRLAQLQQEVEDGERQEKIRDSDEDEQNQLAKRVENSKKQGLKQQGLKQSDKKSDQRPSHQGVVKAVEPNDYQPEVQQYQFVHQLPFSIRKDLPKFKLNVHIYDQDPESRVAIINGVRFFVNDMIEETVLVKEIVQDGVLLDYNGQEFLVPR